MSGKERNSPFVDPGAVEAWDAWFRLRKGERIEDLSIEETWARVARALSLAEAEKKSDWEHRFYSAMSSWRLLVDERIIAGSCTGVCELCTKGFVGVVNAAAFVLRPCHPDAAFDFGEFARTSELAMRALDNATVSQHTESGCRIRVGMIGVTDALTLLGMRYDSAAARSWVRRLARAFAEGCFRANVQLAEERGGRYPYLETNQTPPEASALFVELVARARAAGLRHDSVTMISPNPKLALLANNVADALDPLHTSSTLHTIESAATRRTVRSPGYAAILAAQHPRAEIAELVAANSINAVSVQAQIELRIAMQSWIDMPIDYPVPVAGEQPNGASMAQWRLLASENRLGDLRIHLLEPENQKSVFSDALHSCESPTPTH